MLFTFLFSGCTEGQLGERLWLYLFIMDRFDLINNATLLYVSNTSGQHTGSSHRIRPTEVQV